MSGARPVPVNGVAWSRAEIDMVVTTFESNGCLAELAATLSRTPIAVASKAARLGLKKAGG